MYDLTAGASCAYEIRCSTEGSTGVVLRDLRKLDRPGVCMVAPGAMMCFR